MSAGAGADGLATILVLESNRSLGEELAQQLAADGYRVELARSAEHARLLAGENPPRLALLGETTPARETLALLKEIRHGDGHDNSHRPGWDPDLPALVLGESIGELETLRAFEAGADDYLPRTCAYLELRARLGAILRRATWAPAPAGRLEVGALTIDLHARSARVGATVLALRRLEFDLLAHLAREPRRVFAREELLRSVWGYRCTCSTRTVDSHASRLRRKLASGPEDGEWIVGVRGVGYRLM
jgi:DNA-binding response OmpR family regulator